MNSPIETRNANFRRTTMSSMPSADEQSKCNKRRELIRSVSPPEPPDEEHGNFFSWYEKKFATTYGEKSFAAAAAAAAEEDDLDKTRAGGKTDKTKINKEVNNHADNGNKSVACHSDNNSRKKRSFEDLFDAHLEEEGLGPSIMSSRGDDECSHLAFDDDDVSANFLFEEEDVYYNMHAGGEGEFPTNDDSSKETLEVIGAMESETLLEVLCEATPSDDEPSFHHVVGNGLCNKPTAGVEYHLSPPPPPGQVPVKHRADEATQEGEAAKNVEGRKSKIRTEIEAQAERVRRSFADEPAEDGGDTEEISSGSPWAAGNSWRGVSAKKRRRNEKKKKTSDSVRLSGALTQLRRAETLSRDDKMLLPPAATTRMRGGSHPMNAVVAPRRSDGRRIFQGNFRRQVSSASSSSSSSSGHNTRRSSSGMDSPASLSASACPGGESGGVQHVLAPSPLFERPLQVPQPSAAAAAPVESFTANGRQEKDIDDDDIEIIRELSPLELLVRKQNSDPNYVKLRGAHGSTITVTKNDVLLPCASPQHPTAEGRSAADNVGISDSLIGNRRYRVLIDLHRNKYANALTEEEKRDAAGEVVRTVRRSVPPGRFLRRDEESDLWREEWQDRAVEETLRALEEKSKESS